MRKSSEESLVLKKHPNYKKRLFKRIKLFIFLVILVATTFWISMAVKKTITLYYKENSNINYLVYVKQDEFYTEPFLPKGMQYPASSINYIDINFNYNFKMNEQINYDYYYYIEADVKVFDQTNHDNIIFQKKQKLVDDKVYTDQEGLAFSIDENLKVNYGEYNDLIRDFKSSYNLTADSSLTLTMYIYVEGDYKNLEEPIRAHNAMDLVIPLTTQTIDISLDYKEINNSDVIKETSAKGTLSNLFLGISIFILALTLISLVDLIGYILKAVKRKTPYQKKLQAILREYDRTIVTVSNSTALSCDTNFIEVSTFEEILDVSDRLEQPILFYEIQKGQRSEFIVRKDNDTYFYIIDADDLNEDY